MTAPLSDPRPPGTDAMGRTAAASAAPPRLVDPFGRAIAYVRLSVTDRCNFRCVYCMAEKMTFLPHAEVLRLEELDRLCSIFFGLGVKKIRLTGGEPLVRRGVMTLVQSLSRRLRSHELDELTLTTNGSQLARYADALAACGVKPSTSRWTRSTRRRSRRSRGAARSPTCLPVLRPPIAPGSRSRSTRWRRKASPRKAPSH